MTLTTAPHPLLRHPPFQLYFLARTVAEFASQMAVVAIGRQVCAKTNSALTLGLIG